MDRETIWLKAANSRSQRGWRLAPSMNHDRKSAGIRPIKAVVRQAR